MGEHLPCKQGVSGSNPLISTTYTEKSVRVEHIENYIICEKKLKTKAREKREKF